MCKSCCKIHRSQFHDAGKPAGTIALICGIEAGPNCLKNYLVNSVKIVILAHPRSQTIGFIVIVKISYK